tara:strand:- start:126 stop:398 length:273 start_codon:yes stop_codon:yes gene_type:complete
MYYKIIIKPNRGWSSKSYPLFANQLKVGIVNSIKIRESIEDLITYSLTEILTRSLTLDRKSQIGIPQEFKEWLNGENQSEDILVLKKRIK